MGMAAVEKRSVKTDYLERNPYGEGAYEETLQVELEGKQEEIQIYVEEQKYTEADKKRYLKEAEKELNTWFQRVCGDKGEIRQSLSFPDKLEQNPVTLSWSTSQPQILDWEGVLGTGVAPKGEMVDLMCTITLEEEMKIWQKEVRVYPPRRTEKEALQEEIQVRAEKLSEENSKKMYLPETYQGEAVHYRRTAGNTGYLVCVLSVLLGFGIFPLKKERERQKEELRKKEMQRDYPDVLDKLVLFLQAGFSIRKAMEKLAIDYQRNRQKYHMKERAAYEEIVKTCREMEGGVYEADAYERMGKRCKISQYKILSVLLVQNLRKGNQNILELLEREAASAGEERKREARVRGEEASVKLLLPMIMQLMVVLVILMVPAFLSFL
ncbi:type II secretion system F family protein [Blautia hansenii]|uniref:Type II secretion system F family protein n=2 Tax=Lachnospiraceae TaxID=186803 RepID=A0ABX2IA43_BLAHA|nr:type II secretion system F family protein [Blautia hansenii]